MGGVQIRIRNIIELNGPFPKKAFVAADNVYFELDLTQLTEEREEDSSCQLLPDNQTLSDVLTPDMQHRLTEHMDWTRQQITSWLTEEQKLLGLNGTFIFSAFTEGWHRKRPLWLR